MRAERAFPWLLGLNGAASAMAALVLGGAPSAIPGMVGIVIAPSQYFVVYLLASAELALAALCVGAIAWRGRQTDCLATLVLVTVHVGSITAGIAAYGNGGNTIIGLNVIARGLIVIAVVVAFRALPRGGPVQ